MIIFKYLIEPGDKIGMELPQGAELLSVQIIDDQPYLYALVDEKAPKVMRHFRLVPTGIPFDLEANSGPVSDSILRVWGRPVYIATFQIKHEDIRPLVFHLFEIFGQ